MPAGNLSLSPPPSQLSRHTRNLYKGICIILQLKISATTHWRLWLGNECSHDLVRVTHKVSDPITFITNSSNELWWLLPTDFISSWWWVQKYKHHMWFDIKQQENRFKEIGSSKEFWFVNKTKTLWALSNPNTNFIHNLSLQGKSWQNEFTKCTDIIWVFQSSQEGQSRIGSNQEKNTQEARCGKIHWITSEGEEEECTHLWHPMLCGWTPRNRLEKQAWELSCCTCIY